MKKAILYLTLIILFPTLCISQTPQLALEPDYLMNSSPEGLEHPIEIESNLFSIGEWLWEIRDYYVVEQRGVIKLFSDQTDVSFSLTALDIQDRVNDSGNERGLLGLALHPDFPNTPYIYVNYTGVGGATFVSRFSPLSNGPGFDPESELILLTIPQPYSNHNGGDLHFGPDGYLYIGTGDGGSAGDPGNRAQNPEELLGKMLRIDVNNASEDQPYTIPPDNPFADTTDGIRDEIWAFGLRNPWRFTFDRETGDMWIADVGQDQWEEIDFEPAGSGGGANYGWRCYEGNHPYNTNNCGSMSDYDFPIFEYQHSFSNGCSVTGGIMYRYCRYPLLYGRYLFIDYCSGKLWSTYQDDQGNFITEELADFQDYNFASMHTSRDGRIYLVGRDDNTIYELIETTQEMDIYADISDEYCTDDMNNGSITLHFGDFTPASILWDTGDTTATIENLDHGYYSVTVTFDYGCMLSHKFYVDFNYPPPATITYDDNNGTLIGPSGYNGYNWYFNGELIGSTGPDENTWVPQENGYYQVGTLAGSCETISDSLLVTNVATLELPGNRIEIFPNPFGACFYVRLLPASSGSTNEESSNTQLSLYDSRGRLVLRQQLAQQNELQQICLPPGPESALYILELSNERGKGYKKLLHLL